MAQIINLIRVEKDGCNAPLGVQAALQNAKGQVRHACLRRAMRGQARAVGSTVRAKCCSIFPSLTQPFDLPRNRGISTANVRA